MAKAKQTQPEVVEQSQPEAVDVTQLAILEMKRGVENAAKESAGTAAKAGDA